MWRKAFNDLKNSTPKLNMGAPVTGGKVAYTPTTELGWRDHFADQRKAQMTSGIGSTVASHLTDDTDHQAQIAGAINNFLGAVESGGK